MIGYTATALLSGAVGWFFNAADRLPAIPPDSSIASSEPSNAPRTKSIPMADTTPLIAIASDGNATLRVEQQPLEWVLEEISKQSGWHDIRQRAGVSGASQPVECAQTSKASAEYAAQLMRATERGREADRHLLLLQARADGVALPDDLLTTLFTTDSSDEVRLYAFDLYLESRTGDADALRSALEAAFYVPNDAVRQMAKQRLEDLLGGS